MSTEHALTSSSLQLVQWLCDDIDHLLTRMTGDEKHARAAFSTLDVIRVLYERVLDVSPETVDDPRRDRFLLSKGHGPMAYYAVLCDRGFFPATWLDRWGVVRLAARLPPRPQPGARRRDLVRLARPRAALSPSGRRSGCARRGSTSRVVVLVGDAELDEGSNHEALELAAALGPRRAHGRGDRQPQQQLRRAGADRRAVRDRGLAGRRPSTAATTTRSRRPCPTAASACRTPSSPPSSTTEERGGMTTLTRDPRTQFARTVDRPPRRGPVHRPGLGRDLGPLLRRGGTPPSRPRRQRRHPRAAARQRRRRDGPDRAASDRAHLRHVPGRARLRAGEARLRPPGRRRRAGRGRRLVRRLARRPHAPGAGRRRPDRHPARGRHPRARARRPRPTRCCGGRSRPTGCTTSASSSRPTPTRSRGAGLHVVRRGSGATVVALGPVLDEVLAATAGRDVTVLYAHSVRPFDARTFRSVLDHARRGPGRALAGRHLGPLRRRGARRRTAPPAGPGHAPYRAPPLRHPRRAPARPRSRRRGHPPLAGRVPGCVTRRSRR